MGEWGLTIAPKYCLVLQIQRGCVCPQVRLLLHEFILAHWYELGSPLTKFDWLSQNGGEGSKSDLGPPTLETRTLGHNSRRRHAKHHIFVPHSLARSMLVQSSVADNQVRSLGLGPDQPRVKEIYCA